jgi:hypothetical protein
LLAPVAVGHTTILVSAVSLALSAYHRCFSQSFVAIFNAFSFHISQQIQTSHFYLGSEGMAVSRAATSNRSRYSSSLATELPTLTKMFRPDQNALLKLQKYTDDVDIFKKLTSSVADPGSGAFLTPGSGIRDEQPGSYFRVNSSMRIRDLGWKKFGFGIRDKHPGSATLLTSKNVAQKQQKNCFLSSFELCR